MSTDEYTPLKEAPEFPKREVYFISTVDYDHREGEIQLEEIAERVYGKPFDVGRSAQAGNDRLTNDSFDYFLLAEDYEEYFYQSSEKKVYLGYDPISQGSTYHEGHTAIEYWQSVSWEGLDGNEKGSATVPANTNEWEDKYGAIYPESFYAQRETSPPLMHVLADLIHRGEIPLGDYLLSNWW